MPAATKPPRRTVTRKGKAEATKLIAKTSNTHLKSRYSSASASTSSRTIVQKQEQEDYSSAVYAYADELLKKHVAFVDATKDLPTEDEDEGAAMQVDGKGKRKRKAETLTLRERVFEAYKATGGEPADGRWTFLAHLLRLQCTLGKYRWIAPQKSKMSESNLGSPTPLELKQWSKEIVNVLGQEWKPPSGPEYEERLRVLARSWKPDKVHPARSSVVVRGILEKREWAKEVGELVRQWLEESTLDGLTEIREIVEKTKLVDGLEDFLQSLIPTDTYEPNKVKEVEKERWIQLIKEFVRRWGMDSDFPLLPSSEAEAESVSPKQKKAEQLKEKVKTWQMSIYTDGASAEKQQEVVSSSKSKSKKREAVGRDPADPTPLGFTVSKSSAARLGIKGKPKTVSISSTRKPDDEDLPSSDVPVPLPGPATAKGISAIPESSFLPPSFSSSQLQHSTPNPKLDQRKPRKPSPIPCIPLSSSLPSDPSAETPFVSSPSMRNRTLANPMTTTTIPTNNRNNKRARSPSPSALEHRRPAKQSRTEAAHRQHHDDDVVVGNGHDNGNDERTAVDSSRMNIDQNSSQNQMPPPPPTSSPLTPLPATAASPLAFRTPDKALGNGLGLGKGKSKALPTLTELLSARKAEAEVVGTPRRKVSKYSLAAVSPFKIKDKAKVKKVVDNKDEEEDEDRSRSRAAPKEKKEKGDVVMTDAVDVEAAAAAVAGAITTNAVNATTTGNDNSSSKTSSATATTTGTASTLVPVKPKPKPKSKAKAKLDADADVDINQNQNPKGQQPWSTTTSRSKSNSPSADEDRDRTGTGDRGTDAVEVIDHRNHPSVPALALRLIPSASVHGAGAGNDNDANADAGASTSAGEQDDHVPTCSNGRASSRGGVVGGTGGGAGAGAGPASAVSRGGVIAALETQTTVATTVPQHQPEYTASGYAVDLNLSGLSVEAAREGWGRGRRGENGKNSSGDGKVKQKEKEKEQEQNGKAAGKTKKPKRKRYFGMDDVDLSSPDKMKAKSSSSLADSDSDSDSSSSGSGGDELNEDEDENKAKEKAKKQEKGITNILPDFTHDEDAFAPPLMSTQHRGQDHARASEGTSHLESHRVKAKNIDISDDSEDEDEVVNDINMPPDFTNDEDAFDPPLVSTQPRGRARNDEDTPRSHRLSELGFDHSQSDPYASPPPIFGADGKINVRSLDEPLDIPMSSPMFLIDSPPKPKGKTKGKELVRAGSEAESGSGGFGFGFCSQMDVEGNVNRVSRVLEKDVSLMDEDLDGDVDMDIDGDRDGGRMWGGWY